MPFLVFCLLTKEAITWGSEVTSRKGMHYTYLVSSFRILVSWSPCSLGWSWDLLWTIRCKGMPDVELWGKFFFWGKIKELDEEKSFYSLFSYLEQWCEDIMFGTMTSLSCDQVWGPKIVRNRKIEPVSLMTPLSYCSQLSTLQCLTFI